MLIYRIISESFKGLKYLIYFAFVFHKAADKSGEGRGARNNMHYFICVLPRFKAAYFPELAIPSQFPYQRFNSRVLKYKFCDKGYP